MLTKSGVSLSLFVLVAIDIAAQVELPGERTMYSSVYLKENGQREAVICATPVHFNNNGVWDDISTNITADSNGFKNTTNVIQSFFPVNYGAPEKIRMVVNGQDEIFVNAEKRIVLSDEQAQFTVINSSLSPSSAIVNANTISYSEIYPGISDGFVVNNGEVKNNIQLNALPSWLSNVSTGYFGVQETLEIPPGWSIVAADGSENALTTSALLILDASGSPSLTIPSPVFFDNNGLRPDGLNMVEGKYFVQSQNGQWLITTLVPVTWLKDINTIFPVVIDPTINIAGTTGGWQSPNNFVDNPGFVFLGVCCSNLTHRAWIKFNTTSIPDTMCITNVELQVNVTSVAATSAEGVQVYDVTGAFGPYGGINAGAYTDFGNGFYTSYTITTTGLYGYYSLGASANTVLQSQLPVNWFQVGMRLVNEPSTIYKIISGTTSYIRVTYGPCSPLPVELVTFDATCDGSEVNLSWTTASETNNNYFYIERTGNGIDNEVLGTVSGAGNSEVMHVYSFVDHQPLDGTSYYRLKQTDYNGQVEQFNLVAVDCESAPSYTVYTSPRDEQIQFGFETGNAERTIVIRDMTGREITSLQAEGTTVSVSTGMLPDGIYFYEVNIAGTILTAGKFVVSHQ